eukprot:1183282-Prorocentrum_minimum.AAC.1
MGSVTAWCGVRFRSSDSIGGGDLSDAGAAHPSHHHGAVHTPGATLARAIFRRTREMKYENRVLLIVYYRCHQGACSAEDFVLEGQLVPVGSSGDSPSQKMYMDLFER